MSNIVFFSDLEREFNEKQSNVLLEQLQHDYVDFDSFLSFAVFSQNLGHFLS